MPEGRITAAVILHNLLAFLTFEASVLERLEGCPRDEDLPQWDTALRVWQHYRTTLPQAAPPMPVPDPGSAPAELNFTGAGAGMTFRVTCTRGGRKHCFTSMEAAAHLGAGLIKRYGWKVQMKEADLEVLLTVSGTMG